MAGKAVSIDSGAGGLLRHRFVRAVSASTLVAIASLIVIAIGFEFVLRPPDTEEYGIAGQLAVVLIAFVFMMLVFALSVAVMSGVMGFIHRRISAFILLFVNVLVCALCWYAVIFFVGQKLGLIPPQAGDEDYTIWQDLAIAFAVLVAGAIAFEGIGFSWWQLTTSRPQFMAARGWRAPPWRFNSTMRQTLGLPAFISNFGRGRLWLTATYFLVAVLNVGLVAAILIPIGIFSIDRGAEDISGPLMFILPFAGLLILNVVGVGALLQRFASQQTTRIYQKAREWDARPPVLFLRAFDQDNEKLIARSIDPFVKFPAGCGESRTVDELLLESASIYGPVVAIGDPRDPTPPLGAARIFVEGQGTEWQDVVRGLLKSSAAVVMCPSTSEGVKWELDLIEDAMGRTRIIFIANPELSKEDNIALFARLAPKGEAPDLKKGAAPIAAYLDNQGQWTVLTTKKPACVQTYTVALNFALQALLGMKPAPVTKPKKQLRGVTAAA